LAEDEHLPHLDVDGCDDGYGHDAHGHVAPCRQMDSPQDQEEEVTSTPSL
jgi:hypothetical protein